MQTITGLWLDEAGTPSGRSAANFAYAQVRHADVNGYPVWGWSACADPAGGYLGWGRLRDAVVTPHAAAMARSTGGLAPTRSSAAVGCCLTSTANPATMPAIL